MNQTPEPDDTDLERALRASRTLEEPPAAVLQRAIDLFVARRAERPDLLEPLRRLVATLVADSGFVPSTALGLRSGASGVRQLLYSADGRDIDLRVVPDPDGAPRWQFAGQVLGPDLSGRIVLQDGEGTERAAVDLDESCEFRLPPVAAGRWQIVLVGDTTTIVLPPLDLP